MIQSFLRHALRDGFFHADMHPGNLFVDDDGRLVAVDFGIMGRLGAKERRFLAEILLGFITRDYRRTAEVHFEAGYVPPHHSVENFAQAIRAIGEPIHNRTAEDISMAKLLDAAVRGHRPVRHAHAAGTDAAAEDHGGGRRRGALLDPKLDMWTTAEPVVREWMSAISAPPGASKARRRAPARSAASSAMRRACSTRGARVLEQLDDHDPRRPACCRRKPSPRSARPKRRRQPLDRSGALGDRRAVAIGIVLRHPVIALIAMQS